MRHYDRLQQSKISQAVLFIFFLGIILFLFFQNKGIDFILPGLKKAPLVLNSHIPVLVFQIILALYPFFLTIKDTKIGSSFIKQNPMYSVFLVYCLASIFWSQTPLYSFYRAAALWVIVYYFWIFFYFAKDADRVIRISTHFLNLLLCLSLLYFLFSPENAAHQFAETQGALKGILSHKNHLAQTAILAFFFNLDSLRRAQRKVYSLLMMVLALIVLIRTKSMATVVAFIITAGIYLFLTLYHYRKKQMRESTAPLLIILLVIGLVTMNLPHQAELNVVNHVARDSKIPDLKKDYESAIKGYPILKREFAIKPSFTPDDLDLYIVIATGYERRGDYKAAREYLKRGMGINPHHIGLNRAVFQFYSGIHRGVFGTRLNNLKKADEQLKKLMQLDPENMIQYTQDQIDLFIQYKKFDEVEKICIQAQSGFPMENSFIVSLGHTYLAAGKQQQFENLVEELQEENSDVFHYLKFLEESKKSNYHLALDYLEKWIEEKTADNNITYDDYFKKLRFLEKTKQYKKAIDFNQFLENKYSDDKSILFEILNWKAFLYERTGYFERANAVYEDLASGFPWLRNYYLYRIKGRRFGTIGPFLTKLFLNTPVETKFNQITKRDFTFSYRTKIWYEMYQSFKEQPIFGKGYASFWSKQIEKSASLAKVRGAHNGYLDILNELGLIGLALFLGIWIPLIVRCIKLYKIKNKLGILLITLFVMITALNMFYPLLFRLNQGLFGINILIFAALYAEGSISKSAARNNEAAPVNKSLSA